jgi:hypothetical protein
MLYISVCFQLPVGPDVPVQPGQNGCRLSLRLRYELLQELSCREYSCTQNSLVSSLYVKTSLLGIVIHAILVCCEQHCGSALITMRFRIRIQGCGNRKIAKFYFYSKINPTVLSWSTIAIYLSLGHHKDRTRQCSDPDPDPPDPRVFWPSGSTGQRYGSGSGSGSGSFYHHANIIRIILNPTILWLFLTFYLWKRM